MEHNFRTPAIAQQNFFNDKPATPHFNGPDYEPKKDQKRLSRQLATIRDWMLNHRQFRTLQEIAGALGYPETSVSANLRHLRKTKFGSFTVNRRKRTPSISEYQVVK